jgi:Na+-transporting methylmalonyl-CoA/oxaloacetate decarboxylase gamma subunit
MGPELQQGLQIVVVGIGGVFAILLLLMGVVVVLGKAFGKKPVAGKARSPQSKSKTKAGPERAEK